MGDMGKKGYVQGDMSPKVEDYQTPMAAFSQENFGKTTQYVERQNRQRTTAASDVRKQAYKGRYS
jgi:hypothetical protein